MIKKLLVAIAAIAMPIGMVTVVGAMGSGVAGAAAPAATTTVHCTVTGSVAFQKPGISLGGALSKNTVIHTKAYQTPTGTGCSGVTGKLVIPSSTTLCPQTGGVPDPSDPGACLGYKVKKGVTVYDISTKPYYYNTSASYAGSGVSDLVAAWTAKPPKVVMDNIKVALAVGTASTILPGGACGATASGFEMTGTATTTAGLPVGSYDDLACITGDSGTNTTGDFVTDISTAGTTVATATLGGNSHLYVTFQP